MFEGGEEWLQTSLDGYYRNLALLEENKINLLSEEAIYNGMLGALTAGLFETPGMLGVKGNTNIPISAKPFNTYQFQTADIKNQPISANAFPAVGQRKNEQNVGFNVSGENKINNVDIAPTFFAIKSHYDTEKVLEYLEYVKKDSTIKYDNETVRKWYVNTVSQIHEMVDESYSMEEKAHMAFNLRNEIRIGARNIMMDVETRKKLDVGHRNYTFEELVKSKIIRKGLTEEEAIKDIYETAVKTNKEVNAIWGVKE